MKNIIILQKPSFKKIYNKLHDNQLSILNENIKIIITTPEIGESKKGTWAGVRVHKFYVLKQLMLLAYTYDNLEHEITLIKLGSHQNFYRDL
jgi:mRNA-degrading endonuclease YafQ of YafQ-DinJ toxin-antitoxin module